MVENNETIFDADKNTLKIVPKKDYAEKLVKDFEEMRNMAELKALSKVSLERPLTDREFTRMMMLKNSVFPITDQEYQEQLRQNKISNDNEKDTLRKIGVEK